jgi:hypothetical protein
MLLLMQVFIYNLFVLFRHEILGQKEKIERLHDITVQVLCAACTDGKRWQRVGTQNIGA